MRTGVGTDFESGVDPTLELSLIHERFTAAQQLGVPCVVRADALAHDEAGGAESILRKDRLGVHDVVRITVVKGERDTSRSVPLPEPANPFGKRHADQPDAPQPPEMTIELERRHIEARHFHADWRYRDAVIVQNGEHSSVRQTDMQASAVSNRLRRRRRAKSIAQADEPAC